MVSGLRVGSFESCSPSLYTHNDETKRKKTTHTLNFFLIILFCLLYIVVYYCFVFR